MSGPTTAPGPTAVGYAMRETTPSIHLIARPSIDVEGMRDYLRGRRRRSVARPPRRRTDDDEPNAAQLLVEFGGPRLLPQLGARA